MGRSFDPPMPVRRPPEDVRVTNWPGQPNPARDYFDMVRYRYEEYRAAAKENQIAVMRYYTFRGEEISIATVTLYDWSGTLLIIGEDQFGNPADVITQPQGAQIVVKLLTLEEPPTEPQRKPVGFTTESERPA